MRCPASEELEIIKQVEVAQLSARQTLSKLGLKWSCFIEQFCGLTKMHFVSVHAVFRVSALPKYAMSGVRLSRAV